MVMSCVHATTCRCALPELAIAEAGRPIAQPAGHRDLVRAASAAVLRIRDIEGALRGLLPAASRVVHPESITVDARLRANQSRVLTVSGHAWHGQAWFGSFSVKGGRLVRLVVAFERLVVHDKRPALVADGERVVCTLALLWDALWRGVHAEDVQFIPAGVEQEVGACGVARVVKVRRASCFFATIVTSRSTRTAWGSPAHSGTIGVAPSVRIRRPAPRR